MALFFTIWLVEKTYPHKVGFLDRVFDRAAVTGRTDTLRGLTGQADDSRHGDWHGNFDLEAVLADISSYGRRTHATLNSVLPKKD